MMFYAIIYSNPYTTSHCLCVLAKARYNRSKSEANLNLIPSILWNNLYQSNFDTDFNSTLQQTCSKVYSMSIIYINLQLI